MSNENDLPKKKESLMEKFVRIVLRKKQPAQKASTPAQPVKILSNYPKTKQKKENTSKNKPKKTNKSLKFKKTIKKISKQKSIKKPKICKNSSKSKIKIKLKKTRQITKSKNTLTSLPNIAQKSLVNETPKQTPQIQINTFTPTSNTPSTFTELEEEALKAKQETEQKEEAKNAIKEKEMIKEMAEKINKNNKLTDFDRVLNAIQKYGSVEAAKLRKELNIPEKQFSICYSILQKNGEINVEYPLVGRMKLIAVKKKKVEE